jgi:hypothetical protein
MQIAGNRKRLAQNSQENVDKEKPGRCPGFSTNV